MNTTTIGQNPLIQGRDFIIIGLQPWYYEIGSNCKNIATRLALHNRVLYVNSPINRKTWLSRKKTKGVQEHHDLIKTKGEKIRLISPNLWEYYPPTIVESVNGIPYTRLVRSLTRLNNRRFAADIREAVTRLDFHDYLLFNDNDVFNGLFLKEALSPALSIYYMRDFLQGYPYFQRHLPVLEPELLRGSDLVVANSLYYSGYAARYNKRAYYIGQGCNIDLFDPSLPRPRPEALQAIKSPIIGYVGALDSERLDQQVIKGIALANSDWQVVLVGPEDEAFRTGGLHGIPNIHFLGRQPYQQLPAYITAFDVCINPQVVNPITRGNYPLKIDEYLAMGKPVVATRTEAMKLFEDYTYLAAQPEDYPRLISQALAENTVDQAHRRTAFAHTHTWDNSILDLYHAIGETVNKI
jgi:glycosyltransferase involved in cell wall biosynthesis